MQSISESAFSDYDRIYLEYLSIILSLISRPKVMLEGCEINYSGDVLIRIKMGICPICTVYLLNCFKENRNLVMESNRKGE